MKKTFWFRLISLAAFVMFLALSCAMAEEEACPVHAPSAIGTFPTQRELFTGDAVDYQLTLQVEEETGLRTYTIHNPAQWGIPASVYGVWQYEPETGWAQTAAGGETVQLLLEGASYEQSGFPRWTSPCNGADSLTLTAYLGQVRQLYAYVSYRFGNDEISVDAMDGSFIVSQSVEEDGNVISCYASYDGSGILAYVSYSVAGGDGSLTTHWVEAVPHLQTYELSNVYHTDGDGQMLYWTNGQWQDENFEPVEAPVGVPTEELPFALTGGWMGVPFEEPGDKPEGVFPTDGMVVDASLTATAYRPWPEDVDAVYLRWSDVPSPALPAASWTTREDGSVAFVLTGLEPWGVQEAHMGTWNWNVSAGDWERDSDSTPGTMTLVIPAGQPAESIRWEQPTCNAGETLTFYLNRNGLLQDARLTGADGSYWHMDNQGWMTCYRPLGDGRFLEATYDRYTLLDYSIHTQDENGNPLTQASFAATETDDTVFELACFFVYSTEVNYEEYLWLRNVGWYSYETGEPCDCPEGVQLEECAGLRVV